MITFFVRALLLFKLHFLNILTRVAYSSAPTLVERNDHDDNSEA